MKPTAVNLAGLRPFVVRAQKAVPLAGAVSVLLTGDREIRRLNRTFRHKNQATDVLSFPAPDFSAGCAGDLAISLETAACQARQFGHPLEMEVKILLLHGLLHLAGFDHETDSGEMAAREDALRRRFRLPSTLIARAGATAAPSVKKARGQR
ncbi:MAG: rRNA maturation RNase YbeY [Acidobacteriaceae bacterium]